MTALPADLSGLWSGMLPVLAVMLLVLTIFLFILGLRHGRTASANAEEPARVGFDPDTIALPAPVRPLPDQVRLAAGQVRRWVSGGDDIYAVPWVVVVGCGGAELERLIPEPAPWPEELAAIERELRRGDGRVAFCRSGVVVSFEDGLLDSAHWIRRWQSLITALRACRSDRPLDSLVIALPTALFGAAPQDRDRLAARGEQLYRLIWAAQRITGWRIPVYLVLTGCERLIGFDDLVFALPPDARNGPFGWAVPYALDTAFEPAWIDEGIAWLAARLTTGQILLDVQEAEPGTTEGLLLLPGEVQALGPPLSMLLSATLRPSAYHEAFMFRGFFLTGNAGAPGTGSVFSPRGDAFARRLFETKIFPEHRLAQPAYGEMTRRHRQIRVIQAVLGLLVLLGAGGMFYLHDLDTVHLGPVQTLLDDIARTLTPGQHARPVPGKPADTDGVAAMTQSATGILQAMSDISLSSVETLAAPTSLLSSADAEVGHAISAAFDASVLRAAHQALSEPAALRRLLDSAPIGGAGETAQSSLQALDTTAGNIVDYDRYLKIYGRIVRRPNINELAGLMDYALGISLPPGFTSNYDLYLNALNEAAPKPISVASVQPAVEQILQQRVAAVMDATYLHPPLAIAAASATAATSALLAAPPAGQKGDARAQLVALRTALRSISILLPRADYAWLSGGEAVPVAVLARLANVDVLGPGVLDGMRQRASNDLVAARDSILHAELLHGIPLIQPVNAGAPGGTTNYALSDPAAAVLAALDVLLGGSTPATTASPAGPTVASDARILWLPQPLQQAEGLAEDYMGFAAKQLQAVPNALQGVLQQVAAEQFADQATVLIHTAQGRSARGSDSGSASAMRQEISGFASALPILTNLRDALRAAGRAEAADQLDATLAGQASRLLREVDGKLSAASPYQLANPSLTFWNGTPPLAAPAFGAENAADLASTLPPRRDFVEALARDAAPLVAYLLSPNSSAGPVDTAVARKWQAIQDSLDRYHRSDPSSSLTELEQFITVGMDKLDPADCRQIAAGAGRAADWFAQQLAALREAVANRCGYVARRASRERFASVTTDFDANLAGHFPFSTGPLPADGGAVPGAADPGAVQQFFTAYADQFAPLQSQFKATRPSAAAFFGALVDTQAALAPLLTNPSPLARLTYDIDLTFFPNPSASTGSDQVIEIAVRIGDQRVSSLNGKAHLTWTDGQSVRADLRWAANAPLMPAPTVPGRLPRVAGLTATFFRDGPWALLAFLRAQAADPGDLAALPDRTPEVVELKLPLVHNPAAASGGDADLSEAHVFMTWSLTGVVHTAGQPDKRVPVILPNFPTAAPAITVTAARGNPAAPKRNQPRAGAAP